MFFLKFTVIRTWHQRDLLRFTNDVPDPTGRRANGAKARFKYGLAPAHFLLVANNLMNRRKPFKRLHDRDHQTCVIRPSGFIQNKGVEAVQSYHPGTIMNAGMPPLIFTMRKHDDWIYEDVVTNLLPQPPIQEHGSLFCLFDMRLC